MGIIEPTEEGDEVVQFTEPKKGTYKKLIIRNGRLVGGILLGDINKAPYLPRPSSAIRRSPKSGSRCSSILALPAESEHRRDARRHAGLQLQRRHQGVIVGCVKLGKRSAKSVMEATRAGMGCGACKALVSRSSNLRAAAPPTSIPLPTTMFPGFRSPSPSSCAKFAPAGLRSVSAVFRRARRRYRRPGEQDRPRLAAQTLWHDEYKDERDARFINDRVHANIQKDGTFSVIPQIPGGVTSAAQLRRIADVAEKYHVPLVK